MSSLFYTFTDNNRYYIGSVVMVTDSHKAALVPKREGAHGVGRTAGGYCHHHGLQPKFKTKKVFRDRQGRLEGSSAPCIAG